MAYPPVRFRCNCFSNLVKNIRKVRRDLPMIFEVLVALCILCVLLLVDIIWLGRVHSQEIQELDQLHSKDLNRFRKQFDMQMHDIEHQQQRIGSDLEAAHSDEVNRLKLNQQQELEKKIANIQEQLNGLLGLSKNYWEKHAEKHKVEFDIQAPKINDNNP